MTYQLPLRVFAVTAPDPGFDFEPGVAVVARLSDEAWLHAKGHAALDDVEQADARIQLLDDPALDAWAAEHEIGAEVPLVLLRPHGWREVDDVVCTSCDMASCGVPEFEVCGWCDRCRECAEDDDDGGDPDYHPCQECGL